MKPTEAILRLRKAMAFKQGDDKRRLDLLLDRTIRYSANFGNKDFRQDRELEEEIGTLLSSKERN